MIIEIPDDATTTIFVHARNRAHVKDIQAQFPDAKWTHKVRAAEGDNAGYVVLRADIGKTEIKIFPKQRSANA